MNSRRKRYPVKTGVNLLYREKPKVSLPQLLLAALVFAVVLGTFSKFAVIDRLAASGKALREAEKLEEQVLSLKLSNVDYEDVLREYQHYYFSFTDTEGEAAEHYVNCLDVLELLDTELINKAGIQMVNLSGNVLTVNLTKINLEGASAIAKSLSQHELVQDVMVSAANKQQESEGTTVFLNLVLKPESSGEAEQELDTEENY